MKTKTSKAENRQTESQGNKTQHGEEEWPTICVKFAVSTTHINMCSTHFD